MTHYQFLCTAHRIWVDANPKLAFQRIESMSLVAERLVKQQRFDEAIPYLGTALESAEIIFENRLESPQLSTKITGLAIMLAQAYEAQQQAELASSLLKRIKQKFHYAIECAQGYATKAAFFQHCASALSEAQSELRHAHTAAEFNVDRSAGPVLH